MSKKEPQAGNPMTGAPFEYGGKHFVPERQLPPKSSFFDISKRTRADPELGICDKHSMMKSKHPYSHSDFYRASTNKSCDLFRCVENGRLYIPCEHQLMIYEDPTALREDKQNETTTKRSEVNKLASIEERRMAGDYAIIQSMFVGSTEVVIGECPSAEPGQRYMCAYCQHRDIMNIHSEVMVSDDYSEIVQIYAERVAEQNKAVQAEKERREAQGIDMTPITAAGCQEITPDDDLNGKVIVIRPVSLRREFRDPTHQLKLCVGGFGASPHSRGSAVFCTDLYTGKDGRYERWDVLGTMEPEALPEWAKRCLADVQAQKAENSKRLRSGKEER